MAPYFATVALAGQALTASGDEEAKRRWLPGIADGSLTATLAVGEDSGSWDLRDVAATAEPAGERLDRRAALSSSSSTAIPLTWCSSSRGRPTGSGCSRVEGDAPGVERVKLDTLDLTRDLASVALRDAPAVRVGAGQDAAAWLSDGQ